MKTLIFLMSSLMSGRMGIGTIFHSSGDPGNPNPHLACVYKSHDKEGRPLKHYEHKVLDDWKDMVVALPKHYPCLAPVLIYNPRTKLSVMAVVGDRGPKNAMVDLSKAVAKAIGHNGYEKVFMVVLQGARK